MNKSSLAFTGKLNQERFSANLTLNWSSAVYLKLTIGKRFNLVCVGAIEAVSARCDHVACVPDHSELWSGTQASDHGDVRYFCYVREDTALALFEFYKYKNVPV